MQRAVAISQSTPAGLRITAAMPLRATVRSSPPRACTTRPRSFWNSSSPFSVAFTPAPPHAWHVAMPLPPQLRHIEDSGKTGPKPAAARRLRSINSS